MNKLPARLVDHAAVISDDGRYRYWLMRRFGLDGVPVVFIMLNPSTADAQQDDPTIRRCANYAKSWGGNELIVVNLFALRATDPKELNRDGVADPVGPLNDDAIDWAVDYASRNYGFAVCAWGNHGSYMQRSETVRGRCERNNIQLYALRITQTGEPSHPLYLPANLKPAKLLWLVDCPTFAPREDKP